MSQSVAELLDEAANVPIVGFDLATHRAALESAATRDLVVYQERYLLVCRR